MPASTPPINVPITGTDRTGAAFRSVQRRLGGLQSNMNRLGGLGRVVSGALAFGGVAAGIRGVNRAFLETIDRLDEVDKAARNAGVTSEELQSWRLLGQLSGATGQQIDTTLRRIRRRLGEAQLGGEVAKSFEALGVNVRDADGAARNLGPVMRDLVAALGSAENAQQAYAAAIRIGDIESARFFQGVIDGTISAEKFEEVLNSSAVVADKYVQRAAKLRDELTISSTAWKAQTDILKLEFAPVVRNLANTILPYWIERIREVSDLVSDLFDRRDDEGLLDELEQLNTLNADAVRQLNAARAAKETDTVAFKVLEAQAKAYRDRIREIREELKANREEREKDRTKQAPAALPDLPGASAFAGGSAPKTPQELLEAEKQRRLEQFRLNELKRQELAALRSIGLLTAEQYEAELEKLKLSGEAADGKDKEAKAQRTVWEEAQAALEAERRSREVLRAKLLLRENEVLVAAALGDLTKAEADALLLVIQRERERAQGLDAGDAKVRGQADAYRDMADSVARLSQESDDWLAVLSSVLDVAASIAGVLGGADADGAAGGAGFPPGGFGGFRRHGGPVSRGRSYVVGESGPELFTPGGAGYVTPGGARSVDNSRTVVLELHGTDYGADFAAQVEQQTPYIAAKLQEVTGGF